MEGQGARSHPPTGATPGLAQTPQSLLESTPKSRQKTLDYSVSTPVDVLDIRGVRSSAQCVELQSLAVMLRLLYPARHQIWSSVVLGRIRVCACLCTCTGIDILVPFQAQCAGRCDADAACLHYSASQGCQVMMFPPCPLRTLLCFVLKQQNVFCHQTLMPFFLGREKTRSVFARRSSDLDSSANQSANVTPSSLLGSAAPRPVTLPALPRDSSDEEAPNAAAAGISPQQL